MAYGFLQITTRSAAKHLFTKTTNTLNSSGFPPIGHS